MYRFTLYCTIKMVQLVTRQNIYMVVYVWKCDFDKSIKYVIKLIDLHLSIYLVYKSSELESLPRLNAFLHSFLRSVAKSSRKFSCLCFLFFFILINFFSLQTNEFGDKTIEICVLLSIEKMRFLIKLTILSVTIKIKMFNRKIKTFWLDLNINSKVWSIFPCNLFSLLW